MELTCLLQVKFNAGCSDLSTLPCRFEKLENGPEGRDAVVSLALGLASLDIQ